MSDIEPRARPIAKLPALAMSGVPALVAALGERASYRFLEFFTANIRNPHTRRAYARAAKEFFDWLAARGVRELAAIESVHVAAYIEQLQKARSAPTAKLRLAALRHLCSTGLLWARSCR
jgi:site-specific recombinase XerC